MSRSLSRTGDDRWRKEAWSAFNWFLGDNDLQIALYDPTTGGCRDGLHPERVNENQGAESTLAFLMAQVEMRLQGEVDSPRSSSDVVSACSQPAMRSLHLYFEPVLIKFL